MTQSAVLSDDERLVRPPAKSKPTSWKTSIIADLPKLEIDAEIRFIDGMVGKYVAKEDKAMKPFLEVKERVLERQRESRLFLGVIGEFSSGKSTLVNALIREKLLRTDILQGTTAAATLLCYGDSLDVKVRRKKKGLVMATVGAVVSGAKSVFGLFSKPAPPPTRDELLRLIHQSTSDEEFARDIVQVDVQIPSDTLRKGLVVVDTPGANAANPRHALVTAAALRDVCDAAIVVVPAAAAGSESLFNFLQGHAADVLYRCVFVVTKIDMIRRQKERELVLQNLRARITQQLQITNPRVLACAPQFVIEDLDSVNGAESEGFTRDEIQGWVEHFVEMETELEQILQLKRYQAQVDDIAKLAVQLLSHLQSLLKDKLQGYKNRHDALQRIVIPNVDAFISQRIDKHVNVCRQSMDKTTRGSEREFHALCESIMTEMASAIGSASSRSELRTAVESKIPSIYSSGQRRLQRLLERVIKDMSQAGAVELRNFHDEFQKHFRDLATLGGALDVDRIDTHAVARDFSARGEAINSEIAGELKGLDQQQTMATFGGAIGGATIGTMILPGIGTVIGGLLGGMFSLMFGPSLDQLKNDCWSRLQPEVAAGLDSFGDSANEALSSVYDSMIKELSDTIASYLPRYQGLVKTMQERDASEKAKLEEFQRAIQADLGIIENRQRRLDQIRKQFREI